MRFLGCEDEQSGCAMDSNDFLSIPGTEDSAPGRKTSTDIYSYSQPISTFHSQPTPSDHECTGGSSEITPTSDGRFGLEVRPCPGLRQRASKVETV
jgi:hypothetical protein